MLIKKSLVFCWNFTHPRKFAIYPIQDKTIRSRFAKAMSHHSRPVSSTSRRSTSKRRYTASGDNALTNLDEELQTVLRKEYDGGEVGKNEALQDVKTVLKEVSKEPVAQLMEKLMPRFLTAGSTSGESLADEATNCQKQDMKSRNKTPPPLRHSKLTARPTARGKSGQRQLTGETSSVPNIPPKSMDHDYGSTRPATSAPRLPSTGKTMTTKFSVTSVSSDKSSTASTTLYEQLDDVEEPCIPESSQLSLSNMSGKEDEEDELDEDEELPYTENLLEIRADSEDPDEIWKSDIVELTRMKSVPKGSRGADNANVLELKYKEPIWPHHLHLHEILARRPRLTHVILDGSELRFLRDLGSSLQSLITLSICDCGLRSLDAAYAMPNLRTLIARSNKICIPTQCSFLTRLCYLDLSSNPISTFDEFSHLILCGELRILKLHDTPLATHPNFNKEMKRLVPQLKEIHPSQYDILEELKQIRKQGQHQQMWEESKQGEDKGKSRIMPSLAYDDVMLNEPKSGIAYQKIPKPKRSMDHQESEMDEDVSSSSVDFTQVYMAPKFLQHLKEAMPPSTAEIQEQEFQLQHHQEGNFLASTAASTSLPSDDIYHGDGEEDEEGTLNSNNINIPMKKSDLSSSSTKHHPGGDGDSCPN